MATIRVPALSELAIALIIIAATMCTVALFPS
jgi:hypothetical protein